MKKARFTTEQIIGILQEHAAGATPAELTRFRSVSKHTLHVKKRCGGLQVSDANRPKTLEDENARLKSLVADQAFNLQVLKDVLR